MFMDKIYHVHGQYIFILLTIYFSTRKASGTPSQAKLGMYSSSWTRYLHHLEQDIFIILNKISSSSWTRYLLFIDKIYSSYWTIYLLFMDNIYLSYWTRYIHLIGQDIFILFDKVYSSYWTRYILFIDKIYSVHGQDIFILLDKIYSVHG